MLDVQRQTSAFFGEPNPGDVDERFLDDTYIDGWSYVDVAVLEIQ